MPPTGSGSTTFSMKNYFRRKTVRLNAAYLFTTLGDRMWLFAIGYFMHKLGGMTWVAVQQFADALVKLLSLPIIGSKMDKRDRNNIIQFSLAINNVAVGISACLFCICFYISTSNQLDTVGLAVFTIAVLFASVSRLASEAQKICFTKDWIVVITSSYPEEGVTLSQQNTIMTIIDQTSSVILPMLTGIMFEYLGRTYSCIAVIIYNLISWYIESNILKSLYNQTPALKNRGIEISEKEECEKEVDSTFSWLNSFKLYFQQSSWMAAFGLALLYMTVLGFDNLAGSYGQKHGMSLSALGILRTLGSLFGVLGALSYGKVAPRIGLLWTTFLGLTWQNIFIALSGVSTTLPSSPMNVTGFVDSFDAKDWLNNIVDHVKKPVNDDHNVVPFFQLPPSVLMFFMGITLARFGLWMADPAITQIQQETIPESQRYSVFAMQTALCEAFSLFKDTIVILFPNTELFGALAILSCIFVFTGYMFNNVYFMKNGCSRSKTAHLPQNETEMNKIVGVEAGKGQERNSLLQPDVAE